MKTRTTKVEASALAADVEESTNSSNNAFTPGPSSELWIFEGLDEGAVPYEIDLPHPRTGVLSAFALAPKNGAATIGDIRVFASNKPASFLTDVGPSESDKGDKNEEEEKHTNEVQSDRQTRTALISEQSLRFVTEIDPVFLLLPIFEISQPLSTKTEGRKGVFESFDDLMDRWREQSEHVSRIVDSGFSFASKPGVSTSMVTKLQAALERCCDTVMAGDETMYRYSEEKFFSLVLEKGRRMVAVGLPPSLEDMALRTVEAPAAAAIVLKRTESESDAKSVGTPGPGEEDDSQASKTSSVFSQAQDEEGAATIGVKMSTTSSSSHLDLMRLRIAVGFVLSNYVPPVLSKKVLTRLDEAAASGLDFGPLREHLEEVKRQRATMSLAMSSNLSRKRAFDDDEKAEERAEKKRKKEEEEKKKKSESLGIKALRKVNTSGMKKMSAFFTAKPKAK